MEQVTPVTTVTRSRIPWTIAAVWGVALLALAVVGVLAGARPGSAGAPSAPQAVLAAAASTDPSASPTSSDGDSGGRAWAAPNKIGFVGGKGGWGHIGGRISITAISGNQLSMRTDNGWTRTIDASQATIRRADAEIALADLAVGDQIVLRETRQADGTFVVTDIAVLAPTVAGTVTAVDATSVTVRPPDGTTQTIQTTSATTYRLNREAATRSDVVLGHVIHAVGTLSGGIFTASAIQIAPAVIGGTVTGKTADSITVTDPSGASRVIRITSSTTYKVRGDETPTLDDIAVGDVVGAHGRLNSDGSLTTTVVVEGRLKGGPDGFGGTFGRGGHREAKDGDADGASSDATPAPSATS